MSIEYVRETYKMPWLRKGLNVLALGKIGTVSSATHYVYVRLHGEKHARPYHPSDIQPVPQMEIKARCTSCRKVYVMTDAQKLEAKAAGCATSPCCFAVATVEAVKSRPSSWDQFKEKT